MSKSTVLKSTKAIYRELELLAERKREIMRAETQLKKQLVSLSQPVPVKKGKILFKNSRATLIGLIEKKFAKRQFFTVRDVFNQMSKHYPVTDGSKEYKLLHSNVSRTMTSVLREGLVEIVDDVKPRRYKIATAK